MDAPKEVKCENKCKVCGLSFTISSATGPGNLCGKCGGVLLDYIFGRIDRLPDGFEKKLSGFKRAEDY